MKSFSLVGYTPIFQRPIAVGLASQNAGGVRYIDVKREHLGRQAAVCEILARQKIQPKRLRDSAEPPAAPVVLLANNRHRMHFAMLASVSGITRTTSPEKAVGLIAVVSSCLPKGIVLHRRTFGRHIIRLTLASTAGHSRFEGTPGQLIQSFLTSDPQRSS